MNGVIVGCEFSIHAPPPPPSLQLTLFSVALSMKGVADTLEVGKRTQRWGRSLKIKLNQKRKMVFYSKYPGTALNFRFLIFTYNSAIHICRVIVSAVFVL